MEEQAFVTCATNDTYALGALVLAHSLRNVQTSRKLAAIITGQVSDKIRDQLRTVFDVVEEVNVLDSRDEANLALLTRPDLGVTFTKFHCWRLTRFSKCVFLDADIIVLKNCDELFDREELSAVPDVGWPDCFNSGVFVYRPNEETYRNILSFAVAHGSFDGGDQGVLNMFFGGWRTADISKHLSFIYNMNANVTYTYLPAYKQFGKDVKIVHFLGAIKPWMQFYNSETGRVEPSSPHAIEHLQFWWDLFMKYVQPNLTEECGGLAGDLAKLHLSSGPVRFQSSEARQHAWERGQIDYMGADAYENIERKLQSAIAEKKLGEKAETSAKVEEKKEPVKKVEEMKEPVKKVEEMKEPVKKVEEKKETVKKVEDKEVKQKDEVKKEVKQKEEEKKEVQKQEVQKKAETSKKETAPKPTSKATPKTPEKKSSDKKPKKSK